MSQSHSLQWKKSMSSAYEGPRMKTGKGAWQFMLSLQRGFTHFSNQCGQLMAVRGLILRSAIFAVISTLVLRCEMRGKYLLPAKSSALTTFVCLKLLFSMLGGAFAVGVPSSEQVVSIKARLAAIRQRRWTVESREMRKAQWCVLPLKRPVQKQGEPCFYNFSFFLFGAADWLRSPSASSKAPVALRMAATSARG